MINRKILRNAIQTPDGTILHSKHVHDYVDYRDKNGESYIVDGGNEYIRRSVNDEPYIDLTVLDDGLHESRREILNWGRNYDKYMNQLSKTEYIPIKDLDTDHIYKILELKYLSPFYRRVFEDEIIFREQLILKQYEMDNINQ